MKGGKCPICGGDTKEDIVEVQEIIEGEAYIISGVNAECGANVFIRGDEIQVMAVLIDKKGNIVATHLIKISGHYDLERWGGDKVKVFIEEKIQLLKDKADIELLRIDGDNIDVRVCVSEPDKPSHIVETYAYFWMETNGITKQNGLFVDKIDVNESNFENGMYLVVGQYKKQQENSSSLI